MTPASEARHIYRLGGTSIRKLAKRYGVSYGTVWRWLHTERRPKPVSVSVLAVVLRQIAEQVERRGLR